MLSRILRTALIVVTGLLTFGAPAMFGDIITLGATSTTPIGFAPGNFGTGGLSFTYTAASSAAITLGSIPLILNTSTQNFGTYTYSTSALSSNTVNVTLSVTPTVNGTTATTPLVFNGTLETGIHTITQPIPYLIDFDPGLNPTAESFIYSGIAIVAFPFDGDLFGVEVFNNLATSASPNGTLAPVAGFLAPQASTPEPASAANVVAGLASMLGLSLFARRKRQRG